jgi:hypothetical protein
LVNNIKREKFTTMANTYTSVAELKQHLNIEESFTADDNYLLELISISEMAVADYLNGGLSGATTIVISGTTYSALPKTIKHACVLLAAHYYINRTPIAFTSAGEIPYTFQFLLNPHKIITIA